MGSTTGIEWTDATWNPIRGCSRVSEGCRNCYAEKVAYRFSGPGLPYEGLATTVNGHAAWTGEVRFIEEHLLDPLTDPDMRGPVIEHEAACKRSFDGGNEYCGCARPRRIFVNSMSDLFHENVRDEWIDRIFAVMALCPQHTFQVLTKRPERMLGYIGGPSGNISPTHFRCPRPNHVLNIAERMALKLGDFAAQALADLRQRVHGGRFAWPLPNVWLGVSVENQAAADERIPLLLQTPAAVRFISAEPLLGPVRLRVREVDPDPSMQGLGWTSDALLETDIWCSDDGIPSDGPGHPRIDWVIVGGESGPGARPMHPDWARSLRDQCQAAGVPFFFKQWGEWAEVDGGPPNRVFDVDKAHAPIDRANCVISLDGHVPRNQTEMREETPYRWMSRVGKKAAGALLEGREWREFPQ